ncbi:hypothetical protein COBT_000236 [Conglomerata obtusa]
MNVIYLLLTYTQQNNISCIMDSEIFCNESNQLKEVTITRKSKCILISNKRLKIDNTQKMINNAIRNYYSRYKKNKAKATNGIDEKNGKKYFYVKKIKNHQLLYCKKRIRLKKLYDSNGDAYFLKTICHKCSKPFNISKKWEQQLLTCKAICRTCQFNVRYRQKEPTKIAQNYTIDVMADSKDTFKPQDYNKTFQSSINELANNLKEITGKANTFLPSDGHNIVNNKLDMSNSQLKNINQSSQIKIPILTFAEDDTIKQKSNQEGTSKTKNDNELFIAIDEKNDTNIFRVSECESLLSLNTDTIYYNMVKIRNELYTEYISKTSFSLKTSHPALDQLFNDYKFDTRTKIYAILQKYETRFSFYEKIESSLADIPTKKSVEFESICNTIQTNIMKGDIEFNHYYKLILTIQDDINNISITTLEAIFHKIIDSFFQNHNNIVKLFPQCAVIRQYFDLVGAKKFNQMLNSERFVLICVMSLFLQLIEFDWHTELFGKNDIEKISKCRDTENLIANSMYVINCYATMRAYLCVKVELGKFLMFILSPFLEEDTKNKFIIMMTIEEFFSYRICNCIKNIDFGNAIHDLMFYYNISKLFFAISYIESYMIRGPLNLKCDIYAKYEELAKNLCKADLYFTTLNFEHFENFEKFKSKFFATKNRFKFILINKIYISMLDFYSILTNYVEFKINNYSDLRVLYNGLQESELKSQSATKTNCKIVKKKYNLNTNINDKLFKGKLCETLKTFEFMLSILCVNEFADVTLNNQHLEYIQKTFVDICLKIYEITFEAYPFSLYCIIENVV